MPEKPRTLVMTATYNEMENLPGLVDAIWQLEPDVDILVVDDNSPDGTGRWCDERRASEPRLHCIHRAGKLGLGTATVAGLRYAIEHGYDVVINLDADFSHPVQCIGALRALTENPNGTVDVAIGSRYVPGGRIEGWSALRHFMSRGVNFYARTLLRLPLADTSGAFRAYRTSILRQLDFDASRSRGYSFLEEILWRQKQLGARFEEVPITFVDRQRGKSKINWKESVLALWIILLLGIEGLFRPRSTGAARPAATTASNKSSS